MKTRNQISKVAVLLTATVLTGTAVAKEKLDDATIFAILDETHTADVWAARIAIEKAHSEEVRALGKMVARDHEWVQQVWRDLAKQLDIYPSPPKKDERAEALAETVELLSSKSGKEFDRVYLQHEVAFHQSVIDAIQSTLLPAIDNEQLRAYVSQALPAFQHHLAETKTLANMLGVATED
jgi:putative membrane protein